MELGGNIGNNNLRILITDVGFKLQVTILTAPSLLQDELYVAIRGGCRQFVVSLSVCSANLSDDIEIGKQLPKWKWVQVHHPVSITKVYGKAALGSNIQWKEEELCGNYDQSRDTKCVAHVYDDYDVYTYNMENVEQEQQPWIGFE